MTQFVACRFRPGDTRLYTFANDGEPVKEGDFVEAISRGSPKTVEVCSVGFEAPPYACNPVLRKVERPESWRDNEPEQKALDIDAAPPSFD